MPARTPEERAEVARIGGYASWQNTEDRTARTAPARAAFAAKMERQRAEAARNEEKARARLSLLTARRQLREATEAVTVAEQHAAELGVVVEP